jgi:hypothetical protein
MFALHQLTASSRRLGLGIAVAALAITSIVSPLAAHAAPGGPIETPPPVENPAPATAPKNADVKVIARGKTLHGHTTKYHFVVRNMGPTSSGAFQAYKEAWMTNAGNVILTDNGYFPMASLASGQEQQITVSCNPLPGFTCSKAIALVLVNNTIDPNQFNNMATIAP